jgi:hypothetical protein
MAAVIVFEGFGNTIRICRISTEPILSIERYTKNSTRVSHLLSTVFGQLLWILSHSMAKQVFLGGVNAIIDSQIP